MHLGQIFVTSMATPEEKKMPHVFFLGSVWSPPNMLLILIGWLFFTASSIALQASHISCIIVKITSTKKTIHEMRKETFQHIMRLDGIGERKAMDWTHFGQLQSPGYFLGFGFGFGSRQRKHLTLPEKFINSHLHTQKYSVEEGKKKLFISDVNILTKQTLPNGRNQI